MKDRQGGALIATKLKQLGKRLIEQDDDSDVPRARDCAS